MEDTFPEGKRGGNKGHRYLARRTRLHWELSSSNQQPHVYYYHTTPRFTSRASITSPREMAEPVVQTIHRDPALLYV